MERRHAHLRLPAFCSIWLSISAAFAHGIASVPTHYSPRSGPPSGPPARLEILWSQPYDLNGYKVSSEIIGAYQLESRIADDFLLDADAEIGLVRVWGGYYNWTPGDPPIQYMNVHFYADVDCVPAITPQEVHLHLPMNETFIGYDGLGYPTYRYETAVDFSALAGVRTWVMAQADDHPYPPQWGRQQALEERECPAMYYAVWNWPEWNSVYELVGEPYDASLELEASSPVPVARGSWGSIRTLFRR